MKRLSILLLLSLMLIAGLPVKGLEDGVKKEEVIEFDSIVPSEQDRMRILAKTMPTMDAWWLYRARGGIGMFPVATEGFQRIVERWAEEVPDAAVEMPI